MDSSMIGSVMQFHIDSTDPETFVVGQLVYLGDEWFLIQSIAPSGHWDGIMLLLRGFTTNHCQSFSTGR